MSGGITCKCKPRSVEVMTRNANYSAFNGYRRARSAYSLVRCTVCGTTWRTKAAYVSSSPDVTAVTPK